MVDLVYVDPSHMRSVMKDGTTRKFIYVAHQLDPNLDKDIVDKISAFYNSTVIHERIHKIHSPALQIVRERNIDNISIDNIISIISNLISLDYSMFIDLMTILLVMLESKDMEEKSIYFNNIINIHSVLNGISESSNTTSDSEAK